MQLIPVLLQELHSNALLATLALTGRHHVVVSGEITRKLHATIEGNISYNIVRFPVCLPTHLSDLSNKVSETLQLFIKCISGSLSVVIVVIIMISMQVVGLIGSQVIDDAI